MKLKKIKYYKYCIMFIALFLFIPAKVYAISIPQPTQEFYVNDFADVLTDEEEKQMLDKAVNLASEELGIQVVVTTIKSLGGESIENYAHDMYNQYGIGKDDMGVLILLSTEDRDTRIELGTAMEAYITDSKAGRLLDEHAIPHFKENQFNSGLVEVQGAVIDEAATIKTQIIERQEREARTKENLKKLGNVFLVALKVIGWMLLIGIPIGLIVWLIQKAVDKYNALIDEIAALKIEKAGSDEKMQRIKSESDSNEKTINCLERENASLKEKLNDAQEIYPDLYDQIDEHKATVFSNKLKEYVNSKPSASLVSALALLVTQYKDLPFNVQRFVSTEDYRKVESIYQSSKTLQEEAQRKEKNRAILATLIGIVGAISIGNSSNLSRIKEAMSMYNSLDPDYKSEFGSSKLALLKKLLSQAEDDDQRERRRREEEERRRREEEEEEERRRRQRMNSFSSSSSSSSFHGFGGHSSGGGASRHF